MYSYDRTARAIPFAETDIDKMRKDILILMKNVDRVNQEPNDYGVDKIQKDYDKFRQAVIEWNKSFDETMYKDFIPNIAYAIRVWVTGSSDYPELEYHREQEKEWAKSWDKKLRTETWGLHITLLDFPRIDNWTHDKKKWAEKVKREARKAWAILGEFLEWLKHRNVTPVVNKRQVEQVRLEGFQVTVIGYEGRDSDVTSMEIFKAGLQMYRKRAGAVAPILLKQQLPLNFRFDCRMDLGGEYLRDHIDMCASPNAHPGDIAKTMAHEMGHHLFKQLSGSAETYWTTAIHQDLGDLDLRDLLKVWRSGESMWDLMDRLVDSDPILSLQIQGVWYRHSNMQFNPEWKTRDELEEYLRNGGTPTWTVPKHPITGYASKNPEEAFCETIGNAVAFGPQTLDPLVRMWFETILPGQVKFARAQTVEDRVAYRYIDPR